MMIKKKTYISPAASTTHVLATAKPLCASDAMSVRWDEEGDQSIAESRRANHYIPLWDDETDEE